MGELLRPSTTILCTRLSGSLSAAACVLRQRACDRGVTKDTWRGTAARFPSCAACSQGLAIREQLEDQIPPREPRPLEAPPAQLAARRRLRLVGLLDPVATMDAPLSPEAAEGVQ